MFATPSPKIIRLEIGSLTPSARRGFSVCQVSDNFFTVLCRYRSVATVNEALSKRKRVLIADDSESMRKMLRSFVEAQPNIEVCAMTKNGTETVETALALRPDLVILDMKMPGLNGVEVAGVLSKSLPGAKTIIFTMYGDSVGKALASALGVNAVVAKTDGLQGLGRTLQSLLGDRVKVVDECLSRAVSARQTGPKDLEAIAEHLAAPLTRCDRRYKYLWVDRRYAKWLQKPVGEIVGRKILDVIGKEAFEEFQPRFEQALGGKQINFEAAANYRTIGRRRISATYKPTADNDGISDGWIAFVDDITEPRPEGDTTPVLGPTLLPKGTTQTRPPE